MMYLNEQQMHAVNTINGPCLILAGAGSGKTTVIVKKIIQLIKNYGYHEKGIFAIAFTNKSVQEMKQRVFQEIKYINQNNINILTFHALGMKIISSALDAIGYRPNYILFDKMDQRSLIKKIVSNNICYDYTVLQKILLYISYQKNNIISPKKARKKSITHFEKISSQYYHEYNLRLKQYNAFDLDDLIYFAVKILMKVDNIKKKWQNSIKYLLVDEYQDANYGQYKLIQLLTERNKNFTLVGDDDQSIYSWRGANDQNILLLKRDYLDLQVIKMERNYRSSKRILNVANQLISNNVHIFSKRLFSNLENGVKIQVLKLKNEYEEAKEIVNNILSHKSQHQWCYKDYAILYRTNKQSKVFEECLFQNNVPYVIYGGNSFFLQPSVKILISYLKFIINQNDNISFLNIINTPFRKIGKITIKKIISFAQEQDKSYFNVLKNKKFLDTVGKNTKAVCIIFSSWIEEIVIYAKKYPRKVLLKIIYDINYEQWLSKIIKIDVFFQSVKDNINTLLTTMLNFFNKFEKKNKKNEYTTLVELVNQLILHDHYKNLSSSKTSDVIQLMTIHAAKGLEFSSVYIVGLEEGCFPYLYKKKNINLSEERRLFYVAITRARKKLTLSFCSYKYFYGIMKSMKPSRFLFELPKCDLVWK
ncbi:UvrD-helicase domain-containing protein [Buchnera aphidicola]|uniref:UvrD-helicase domain-containing protein n=1 Tax=Buchnera aphidicola TaxID=9 RepID=UPI0031B84B2E